MGYQKQNNNEYEWFKKEIQRRLDKKNTDLFCAMQRIKPLVEILSHQSEGFIFLNKDDFKTVYPALLSDEFKNSKVQLIVSTDVLLNERQENKYALLWKKNFLSQEMNKRPSLASIPTKDRVFVAAPDITCDSFMIFNNRSYIMKINRTEEPYFSCSLNAPFDENQARKLAILSLAMKQIKSVSVEYCILQNKVASQKRNLNRLGNDHEHE